ncbi:anti-sigma-F factor Fin [Weizmannia acidilactici]|uniref:Anti-sigma-F factor Fin n=1 Tax=Weizmannia acidilactici TaxID=2607726 RepID=A0A5J4JKU8_9BACI|nr:anti-sigma-F factor Fin family protein [Weizmannia acidilactici]GER67641.1 anti-sigma-F factor Fin [Weizmannia acidilactici]GER71240.1 anti-sigma-F factor Fin [Weizmannia acidilactici]GER74669.1 anti-sigma-F factor Fin [Weizmannia acidilactici]
MAIHYYCRHCGKKIGTIRENIEADRMGLFFLTEEERKEMVVPQGDGSVRIQSICEDCQDLFERESKFHEYGYLIQ